MTQDKYDSLVNHVSNVENGLLDIFQESINVSIDLAGALNNGLQGIQDATNFIDANILTPAFDAGVNSIDMTIDNVNYVIEKTGGVTTYVITKAADGTMFTLKKIGDKIPYIEKYTDGLSSIIETTADGLVWITEKTVDKSTFVLKTTIDGVTSTVVNIKDYIFYGINKQIDLMQYGLEKYILFMESVNILITYFRGNASAEGIKDYLNFIASQFPLEFVHTENWDTESSVYDPALVTGTLNTAISNEMTPAMEAVLTSDPTYHATVYILSGKYDDDPLNKPIIIGDAFDPFNERNIEDSSNANLIRSNTGRSTNDFISIREWGYDVVFVDFSQGGGDIKKNAKLFTKVLTEVQRLTDEKYLVAGISMSGIIARLSLLYSMPDNNVNGTQILPNVKGFLSIDAPQQGASIGHLQKVLFETMIDPEIVTALKLARLPNDLIKIYASLNVPAAHQMFYGHHYFGSGYDGQTGIMKDSIVKENFYNLLISMGDYRKDIPNYSIAYSNFMNPHANLSKDTQVVMKLDIKRKLDFKIIDLGYFHLATYSIQAGGWSGYGIHEMMPGSIGDWYFDYGTGTVGDFLESKTPDEIFKGTFVPIYSALDLRDGFDVLDPFADRSEENLAAYSPFDKVFYMPPGANGYNANVPPIDTLRYQHIKFDSKLMKVIEEAIISLEQENLALVFEKPAAEAATTFNTEEELWYNITDFPRSWTPSTIKVQVASIDGAPMTGSIFIEGIKKELSGYYSEFPVAYVNQPETMIRVETEENRNYFINWVADMSPPPAITTPYYNPETEGTPELPSNAILLSSENTYCHFSVDGSQELVLNDDTSQYQNTIAIQLQPADGEPLSGTITIGESTYTLSQWNTLVYTPCTTDKIYIIVNTDKERMFNLQWWAENRYN
jgi:hypothetical protein